jgi:hypothetical protein
MVFSNTFLTNQLTNLTGKMSTVITSIQSLTTVKNNLIGQMQLLSVEPSGSIDITAFNESLTALVKSFSLNRRNYNSGKISFRRYLAHINTLRNNSSVEQEEIFTDSNVDTIQASYTSVVNAYDAGDATWKSSYDIALLISENTST